MDGVAYCSSTVDRKQNGRGKGFKLSKFGDFLGATIFLKNNTLRQNFSYFFPTFYSNIWSHLGKVCLYESMREGATVARYKCV